MHLSPILALTIRLAFFLLFGVALAHKLVRWSDFRATVSRYIGRHASARALFVNAVAIFVVATETVVVAACARPPNGVICACAIGGALVAYAFAMLANILAGNVLLDCGCTWGQARQRVGYGLVLRNLALALLAWPLVIPIETRPLDSIEIVTVIMAALTAGVVYAALNGLLAHTPTMARSAP